jgi:hypothetical protein
MTANPGGSQSQPAGDEPSPTPQRPPRSLAGGGLVHSQEFLESLAALGTMMRSSPEAVKRRDPPRRSFVLLIAAGVVLLLALGRDPMWRPWWERGSVPEVFHGRWTTSSERYVERGFVITRDSLQLLFGQGRGVVYPIVRVSTRPRVDSTLFTFHYRDGALDLKLGLHLERDTTIHLQSVPMVAWRKESR